jgi:serine/threonine-protein kinase RsbW
MIVSPPQPGRQEAAPVSFSNRECLRSAAEIGRILDEVYFAMAHCQYSDGEMFAVCLALKEALANAVKHGHGGKSDKVLVKYRIGPDYVLAVVKDRGAGFNPKTVPDPRDPENLERPTGRGLFLMQTYMTWVRYNARGNCVALCKCRLDNPELPVPPARTILTRNMDSTGTGRGVRHLRISRAPTHGFPALG